MFSLVIPALNEEKYLPRLLDSVKEQKLQPDEIIVADANSTDKTVEIAKSYGCRIVEGGGFAYGRNSGAGSANADIIIFLDADGVLPSDKFFNRIVGEFLRRDADLATCFIFPSEMKLKYTLPWAGANVFNTINVMMKSANGINGACMIMKKSVFEELGGFDENLHAREDYDFFNRAFRKKMKLILVPAIVETSVRRLEKKSITKTFILGGILRALSAEKVGRLSKLADQIDHEFWDDAVRDF